MAHLFAILFFKCFGPSGLQLELLSFCLAGASVPVEQRGVPATINVTQLAVARLCIVGSVVARISSKTYMETMNHQRICVLFSASSLFLC